jgi:hypothetical protein
VPACNHIKRVTLVIERLARGVLGGGGVLGSPETQIPEGIERLNSDNCMHSSCVRQPWHERLGIQVQIPYTKAIGIKLYLAYVN